MISCRIQQMRLEKYLSDCGIGTRSQCKIYIRQGKVCVNEKTVKDGAMQIVQGDRVSFCNQPVRLQKGLYLMFHKPAGCVCATKDREQKTVLEYFPEEFRKRLVIVGRLDKDTEGLLLLTDDGTFVHRLMSPKKHVEKTYFFKANGRISKDAYIQIEKGIDIGDEKITLPGRLEQMTSLEPKQAGGQTVTTGCLTICEGRYHQVKRMIRALGGEVFYLKRISIGPVFLDDKLQPGEYRALTDAELQLLLEGSGK